MGLETATYVDDLVVTNPLAGDFKSEGDDHFRMLKTVLKNTFPGMVGKAWRAQAKSSGYTVVAGDNMSVLTFAAASTLNFTAAATLATGHMVVVVNNSAGDVTLDPASTELINGAATLVLGSNTSAFVFCDGTGFNAGVMRQDASGVSADITGNETLTIADVAKVRVITATATVTLPLISATASGDAIILKSLSTGDVQIARQGSDTMDGSTANVRLPSYELIELMNDGTEWIITRKPNTYVGESRMFGISTAPQGWTAEDFSALSRTTYAGLFAEIASTFGDGDGSTTFNVPDSRGRAAIGSGTGTVAEDVTSGNVTPGADSFTVASNNTKWVTGMEVLLTTTGTLPAGLDATPWWIIRVDATTIQFADSLANAQNGTQIDITSTGTGTHTITHTLTARTVAEIGGEESHAMDINELLNHTHTLGSAQSWQYAQTTGAHYGNPINTGATGGNAAMNNMQPFVVKAMFMKT